MLIATPVWAGPSSTNYEVELKLSGVAGDQLSSTNYAIEDGEAPIAANVAMTSTNYEVSESPGAGLPNARLMPRITAVVPASFARLYELEQKSFTVTANDPDSETLEYQLRLDGVVKQAYQASNVLNFTPATTDFGRGAFQIEVRDNDDGVVAYEQAGFVFHEPPLPA